MLNFVLCDDNESVLSKLSSMLDSIFINKHLDARVAYTSTTAEDTLTYVKNNQTNVLMLDINLKSDMSGLQIAQKIRENNKTIYIIFTTAHLEYMLVAYKFKTFDFLPKPITVQRLEETVLRIFDDAYTDKNCFIRLNSKNTIINKNTIKYIKKDGMKLIFYTDTRTYEAYSSFTQISNQLSTNFVRCHKSYIANINKISNIEPNSNTILFEGIPEENKCYIGPKYKNNFMEVLTNHGNF